MQQINRPSLRPLKNPSDHRAPGIENRLQNVRQTETWRIEICKACSIRSNEQEIPNPKILENTRNHFCDEDESP